MQDTLRLRLKPMRIALFTDTYLPTVNGVARTLGRLVEHASQAGHDLFLVSPRVSEDLAEHVVFHRQLGGLPLPMYPELKACRGLDRRGRALLAAFSPDLVHVATEAPIGWSGRAWARKHGVPLVTSFHTNFPEYMAGYGLGWLEKPLWRFLRNFHQPARLTFGPSTGTLRELKERGFHSRLRLWPRGVDSVLFSPQRRRETVRDRYAPGADHVLLYVGRLAPEKRIEVLFEALPKIQASVPGSVHLVVVGDGPYMSRLRKSSPGRVTFTGYLTGVDLAEAYAIGDVLAFPSDTETFGNVVLEALACGVPVVAPNRGGVIDTVIPQCTGVLVLPRDADALATGCIRLLSDGTERRRLGQGARDLALSMSWDTIQNQLLSDYSEACSGPGRGPGDASEASASAHVA